MIVNLKLNRRKILYKYFQILNLIQSNPINFLTDSEIELLTEFILLPEKFKYARFSLPAKKRIIALYKEEHDKKLSMINLNNKLYAMIEKGYLRRDTDKIMYIQDFIMKAVEGIISKPVYDVTIKLEIIDEGENTQSTS